MFTSRVARRAEYAGIKKIYSVVGHVLDCRFLLIYLMYNYNHYIGDEYGASLQVTRQIYPFYDGLRSSKLRSF